MKQLKTLALFMSFVLLLTACAAPAEQTPTQSETQAPTAPPQTDIVDVVLSDSGVMADGQSLDADSEAAVYIANDIIYYESGKDFTYGEGSEMDAHSPEEAVAHTVLHITKPGTYRVSGTLSRGQIAVDLGSDAKKDPDAVVTLILNGADITCQVAPAVIFYNIYECGDDDTEKASKDVDTSTAGANVIIADGTENNISGAYVARIYNPDSVILNADKTQVEDADKLHKYDGAFYSKRSMNIFGGKENTGVLNIKAANEGLDSEMHLTINGGNIHIQSGNDGINTNEDGVSVTTVNGGKLTVQVTGETGEGDGIDSNGWLVINGGKVVASACGNSADAGIDSDMGIHINGGTVIATGHMLDRIEDGGQNYAVFNFTQKQSGSETVMMKDSEGNVVLETCPQNAYSVLVYSGPDLKAGSYSLFSDDIQLAGSGDGMMGGPGGMGRPERPGDMQHGNQPEEGVPPENDRLPQKPDGDRPTVPAGENGEMPGNFTPPEMGGNFARPGEDNPDFNEWTPEFVIKDGGNMFSGITRYSE